MQSASESPKWLLNTASADPLLPPAVALPAVDGRETEVRAFFQRLIELNAQTDQIVMIAAKTDLRHLMGRYAFYIDNLITKAAVDVRTGSAGISGL